MPDCLRRRLEIWRKLHNTQTKEEKLAEDSGLQEEAPAARKYLPFDRYALFAYRLLFWLAPSWWLIDTRRRNEATTAPASERLYKKVEKEEWETALYATAWLVILATAWFFVPDDDTVAKVVAFVALFRLIEISVAILGFVLDQRDPKIARSLITIAALALQVALIFAILDHGFARHDFIKPEAFTAGEPGVQAAETPFEYLYLSWTYMTTLGNPYVPRTDPAIFLQLAATTAGILLIGIVAARAIGIAGETRKIASDVEERVAKLETKSSSDRS